MNHTNKNTRYVDLLSILRSIYPEFVNWMEKECSIRSNFASAYSGSEKPPYPPVRCAHTRKKETEKK